MGIMQSHEDIPETRLESSQYADYKVFDDNEFQGVLDEIISEDLLIEILSHVPAEDLVFCCRLVCKQWKDIIDAQSVWRLKCEREHIKLPTRKLPKVPQHHYRYLYFFSDIENKNLVKNPCGEDKLKGWRFKQANLSHFAFENPPAGADPVPAEVGSSSCFSTTYSECMGFQIINLVRNPIYRYLLRHDLVTIKVGEWYAARFDCASVYELEVILYDNQKTTIDEFKFRWVEEQWAGREWHLVAHEFHNVTDVCFVKLQHMGCDRQFWAGHYGSKMTGAFVKLCLK